MVVLGAVLAMTGRAAGGRAQVDEMYKNGELDLPFVNMPYGWHGGYYNDEYVDYEYSGDYDYDDAIVEKVKEKMILFGSDGKAE